MREMKDGKVLQGEKKEQEDGKIRELYEELKIYRQAIQDAKDALASAEMELDEELEARFREQENG